MGSLDKYFKPILKEEWRAQERAELAKLISINDRCSRAWIEMKRPRPVGRPRKIQRVQDVLPPCVDSSTPVTESRLSYIVSLGLASAVGSRPATYINWFTPSLWNPISNALMQCRFCVADALALLRKKYPDTTMERGRFHRLNESTVRGWIKKKGGRRFLKPCVQIAVQMLQAGECSVSLRGLENTRRGDVWSRLPGMKQEWKDFLNETRKDGNVINAVAAQAILMGWILAKDRSVLQLCGGQFKCSRTWMRRFFEKEMGWTWRAGTTSASTLPNDWEDQGERLCARLAVVVFRFKLTPDFVVNADQSRVPLVPMSTEKTYAMKGSRKVAITGREDKRVVTLLPSLAADGTLLPFQVIFQGKSSRCVPRCLATSDALSYGWHLTVSENHWSTFKTMTEWVVKILHPYFLYVCKKHDREPKIARLICLLDCWSVHIGDEFRSWIRSTQPWLYVIYVPTQCTSELQPVDIILQRPLKAGNQRQFIMYAVEQAAAKFSAGEKVHFGKLDLSVGILREKTLEFLVNMWEEIRTTTDLILKGWEKPGLLRAWDLDFQNSPAFWAAMTRHNDDQVLGSEPEPNFDEILGGPWDGDSCAVTILQTCAEISRGHHEANFQDLNELPHSDDDGYEFSDHIEEQSLEDSSSLISSISPGLTD